MYLRCNRIRCIASSLFLAQTAVCLVHVSHMIGRRKIARASYFLQPPGSVSCERELVDCHKTRRNRGRSRDNTLRSSIGDVIKRTMGRLIGYSNGNTRPEKHRRENDKTVRARSGIISSGVSRGEKIHAGEISLSRSCTTTDRRRDIEDERWKGRRKEKRSEPRARCFYLKS